MGIEQRATIARVSRLDASMAGKGVVTVTVRDRQRSKLEGVAVRAALDGRGSRALRDGESTLIYTIRSASGREHVLAVDRMEKVGFRGFEAS